MDPTEPANQLPELAAAPAPAGRANVRVPGSARTYEVRDVLRGMGLRWDPASHAWHGTLPLDQGSRLVRELGLEPQIVPTIEAFASAAASVAAQSPPAGQRGPVRPRTPHDGLQTNASGSSHPRPSGLGTRTRAEARVAFPGADTVIVNQIRPKCYLGNPPRPVLPDVP